MRYFINDREVSRDEWWKLRENGLYQKYSDILIAEMIVNGSQIHEKNYSTDPLLERFWICDTGTKRYIRHGITKRGTYRTIHVNDEERVDLLDPDMKLSRVAIFGRDVLCD